MMQHNFFRQTIDMLEKINTDDSENSDPEISSKLQGFDSSTKQALADLRAKYPNAPDEMSALLKYITRISGHSEEEDQEHEDRLSNIEQRLTDLEKQTNRKDSF